MNVFALALNHMDQQEIGWMMVAVIFSQVSEALPGFFVHVSALPTPSLWPI